MNSELTKTQADVLGSFPKTADQLAQERNCTTSTIYDHVRAIKNGGHDIGQTVDGEYYEIIPDGGVKASHTNHTEARRQTSASKATITRKANEYMTELEQEIKPHANLIGPAVADGGLAKTEQGQDIVIHRTDDHFGDVVKDVDGDTIFNSDIAEARVKSVFDNAIDAAQMRESIGQPIDTVHLLLGGDHVTNEAIFDGQAWEVEETIKQQLNRATRVYDEEIERLAALFPSVQVVCIGGNHGEFRVDGSSNAANADDFLYDRLEMLAVKAGYDNVQFVKSDRKDFVDFRMRVDEKSDRKKADVLDVALDDLEPTHQSGHRGHLRHGQFVGNHIGTNSRKNDWRGFVIENQFDVAYRGHYHTYKCEHINGRPVIMGGSVKDAGEYANSIGAFGNPVSTIHGVTDETPLAWTEYLYY